MKISNRTTGQKLKVFALSIELVALFVTMGYGVSVEPLVETAITLVLGLCFVLGIIFGLYKALVDLPLFVGDEQEEMKPYEL